MSIQINILKIKLKENIKWFILMFMISFLFLLFDYISSKSPSLEDFLFLLNYPGIKKISNISFLLAIFNFIFYIYIAYVFYTYEYNFSFQNIILREKDKKWIIKKILVFSIYTFLYKIIYTLIIYVYYRKSFSFSFDFILRPVFFNLLIYFSLIIIYNFKRLKYIYVLILVLLIPIIFYLKFNYFLIILFIMLELIFIVKEFKFKKICAINN